MLHIKSVDDALPIFKALGSDIRVQIIKILQENNNMNMNELASRLQITNGALTSHIKKLEDARIITISNEPSGHGNQKKCSVTLDKLLVDFTSQEDEKNIYQAAIKVGHYSDSDIYPTCGLASSTKLIGEVDDVRYFTHPDRFDADILWFTKGYVEYAIPNFIPASHKIDQLSISAELSSEAPGVNNDWPSDINFYLNNVFLGTWTSPGDFGDVKGFFTPEWWFANWNQYGLLKMLVVNEQGTFIDGMQISSVTIDQFHFDSHSNIKLKMAVDDDAEHIGGLTIFGKNFGNYNQDINIRIGYSPINQ